MNVQLTYLQELCGPIMSLWTKISEEHFQHLKEITGKWGQAKYKQYITKELAGESMSL